MAIAQRSTPAFAVAASRRRAVAAAPSAIDIPYKTAGPNHLIADLPRHSVDIALRRIANKSSAALFVGRLTSKATGHLIKRVEWGTIERCREEIDKAYALVLAADRVHPPKHMHEFTDFLDDGVERRLQSRAAVYLKRYGLRELCQSYKRERIDNRQALTLVLTCEEIVT